MRTENDEPSFHQSFLTSADAHRVFRAITREMARWWTVATEGDLSGVGSRVRVDFPLQFGHWVFEAEHLEDDCLVEARCVDAHHSVPGLTDAIDREWLGTRIIFDIATTTEGTHVTLRHDGLTPSLNCYSICVDGWGHFFGTSLKALLDGREPTPHRG